MHKSTLLTNLPNLQHGFFNNQGGLSKGEYSSLNVSFFDNSPSEQVLLNRQIVANTFGMQNFITLKQTHSNIVIPILSTTNLDNLHISQGAIQGDSIVTNLSNTLIAVYTADCVPLLLADSKNKVIATIHCSSKNILLGIIKKTITTMLLLGANSQNIIAAIGPAIEQRSYEVKKDFFTKFIEHNRLYSQFFLTLKDGQYLFDLKSCVSYLLSLENICNIDILNIDTVENNNFFSYRRSVKLGLAQTGRQASVIMLT